VTVSGSPSTGAQTGIVYVYRIAGSSTTARVLRMSGRALVGTEAESGDTPDRMLIAGLRARDRGQGHRQASLQTNFVTQPGSGGGAGLGAGSTVMAVATTGDPVTDGVNGTPRTGATTDPRTSVAFLYMGGGQFVA